MNRYQIPQAFGFCLPGALVLRYWKKRDLSLNLNTELENVSKDFSGTFL